MLARAGNLKFFIWDFELGLKCRFFCSGVHHKKKLCEASRVVKKVQDILVKAKSFLFPSDLKVGRVAPKRGGKNQKNPKGNGGWGDHRDRALCLNMATSSAKNRTNLSQQVIKDLNLNWLTTKMHAANKYPHLTQSLSPKVAWLTRIFG